MSNALTLTVITNVNLVVMHVHAPLQIVIIMYYSSKVLVTITKTISNP